MGAIFCANNKACTRMSECISMCTDARMVLVMSSAEEERWPLECRSQTEQVEAEPPQLGLSLWSSRHRKSLERVSVSVGRAVQCCTAGEYCSTVKYCFQYSVAPVGTLGHVACWCFCTLLWSDAATVCVAPSVCSCWQALWAHSSHPLPSDWRADDTTRKLASRSQNKWKCCPTVIFFTVKL